MNTIKKITSAVTICAMLGSSSAYAMADLTYVSDSIEVSVPYAGELDVNADREGGVLVTAVYNNSDNSLEQVDISDSLSTSVSVNTLNGKTVKNFVLDSMGSLKPAPALSEKSLVLRADADFAFDRTILSWSRMYDFECKYFVVEKNGVVLSTTDGDTYSFMDGDTPSRDNVFVVKGYNSKDELVSLSNEAVSGDGKNVFDASLGLSEVSSQLSLGKLTYSGNNPQISLIGSPSDFNKDTGVGINADFGWTTSNIGGRDCVYTNNYYNNTSQSAIVKRGHIYLELGDDFDTEARRTILRFDYYDTGSGGVNIRYVNGVDADGVATHNVIKVNYTSEGWKTAELNISDCFFNKVSDSRLQRYGDLRFEPIGTSEIGGSPLYLGRIELDTSFDGHGEYAVSDKDVITPTGASGTVRNSGSFVSLMGDEKISESENADGTVSYVSSTATDTAFMYVDDIDGRSAVMSTSFTNGSGVKKTGTMSFALDEDLFVPDDKSYIVKIEFNSKYAVPSINYVSGVAETENSDGSITYKFTYSTKAPTEIIGEGIWKTAVYNVDNALFNYDGNGKYSAFYNGKPVFRVMCSNTIYISRVDVDLPWSEALGIDSSVAEVSFDADGQNSRGVSVYDALYGSQATSDNVMTYTQAGEDNSWAASSNSYRDGNASRKTYLYFEVDDSYVCAPRDTYVELEVTYLDVSNTNMTLQYYTKDGLRSITRRQTASGEWKIAKYILKDAYFANQLNKKTDFRFCLDTTSADYQMIVKNLKVRNITCATQENVNIPAIYLAGDSTCEPFYRIGSGVPREGWGMELDGIFKDEILIVNKAKGGKSTRSFLNDRDISTGVNNPDNRWSEIIKNGKSGDYLFIQFGHNERAQDERYTDPSSEELNEESYRHNLKKFVISAREKGMIPVFLTSLWVRHTWNEDGTLADKTIEPYREAMREIGELYSVPVLDVGAVHKELVERLGEEGSKQIYCYASEEEYPDFAYTREDNTHISKTGAIEVCKIIANEIKRVSAQYPEIQRLSDYLDKNADLEYIG